MYVCAPHSFCDPKNPIRHCDRVALAAANELRKYDTAMGNNAICGLRVSDSLRTSDHDYNRPNTNDSAWRADVRADVKKCAPDFVLEVHSFPGSHLMYKTMWGSPDLAIYESDLNAPYIKPLMEEICKRMPDGCSIAKVTRWHPVSITDDMREIRNSAPQYAQMKHCLFEFNEDIPSERILSLARAVYDAVLAISTKKKESFAGGAYQHSDETKNRSRLVAMLILFLFVSIILFVIGREVGRLGFNALFPQLRG